jgi:hypothetical protein
MLSWHRRRRVRRLAETVETETVSGGPLVAAVAVVVLATALATAGVVGTAAFRAVVVVAAGRVLVADRFPVAVGTAAALLSL